jgi:hypothetical protein
MTPLERKKLINDVFAPKSGEKILLIVDIPHHHIVDTDYWKNRRKLVADWFQTLKSMGEEKGFFVDLIKYNATGKHNGPLPHDLKNKIRKSDLFFAMTEFSATSSLVSICHDRDSKTRGASMPRIERRMEETALKADYTKIRSYSVCLKHKLDKTIAAEIYFSTSDKIFIDLRNREAGADTGECKQPGQIINFPSGEAWKAPYEGVSIEVKKFGVSKTQGILPAMYDGELVTYVVKENRISDIFGEGKIASTMRDLFNEEDSRRNIAEFGIGCNPQAVVTGNTLEDEKAGLHIAYGMSKHLGGKVMSDLHQDICYSKGCPIEAISVILEGKDGTKTHIIKNSELQYDLLK